MFETNLHDDRFLPFEGAGAESIWKLELPTDYPAFDYSTISDVILHLRYTARRGVEASKVSAALQELFQRAEQTGLALLFSLRHDFPNEWQEFVSGSGDFSATVQSTHFPYFTQSKPVTIVGLELYGTDLTKPHAVADPAQATTDLASRHAFSVTAAPDPPGPAQVLARSPDAEVFLVVRYAL